MLIDGRSYHRLTRRTPFSNGMGALELAVLRGVNEGGMKRSPGGPAAKRHEASWIGPRSISCDPCAGS